MIIRVYMPQGTTVRISLGTKAVLDDLKIHKKESYDDEPMTDEELQALREGLEDFKAGRAKSLEDIMNDPGVDKIVKTQRKNGVPG